MICNTAWFAERRGELGTPRSRARLPAIDFDVSVEVLFYGDDFNVRHLRVLLDTTEKDVADACVNANIQFWVRNLEVATGLLAPTCVTAECLPESTLYMVVMGEGDESTTAVHLEPLFSHRPPVDYGALAHVFTNWKPAAVPHLFYFGRFMDKQLSPDVRWLNGYRLAEWYFQGGAGLPGNAKWRVCLERYRAELLEHLRTGQSLHGLFEEARATAAHAIIDTRSPEQRAAKPGSQVIWTFKVLERIVIEIMNDESVCTGRVKLATLRN